MSRYLTTIRKNAAVIDKALAARDAAIVKAVEAGDPVRDIAAAAGLSTARIYQMTKEARDGRA